MTDGIILVLICIVLGFAIIKVYTLIVNANYNSSSSNADDRDDIVKEINRLREAKQTVEAFNLAKKYITQNSQSETARLMYARVLIDIDKMYDAIGHLNILLKKNPKNTDALELAAECYQKTKQPKKAMATYKQILDLDGSNIHVINQLAHQYSLTGEKRTAINMYKKLLNNTEDENEKLEIKQRMLNMYLDLKDWSSIIKYANEILNPMPKNKTALTYLKKAYFENKDAINTIDTIKRIIDVEPYNPKHYEEITALLYNTGNLNDLIQYAKNGLEISGINSSYIINFLSKAYIANNMYSEAQELLKETIKSDHKNIELQKTMADLYCAKDNYDEAIFVFEALEEIAHPSDIPEIKLSLSTVYYKYGRYYLKFDNYTEAFNKFNKAIELDENNPEFFITMGETNYKIKNYTDAAKNYKTALELNPNDFNTYLKLANMYYEIDNILEAKKYFQETLQLEPNCTVAHAILGIIYAKQQEPNNAIEEFQKALELEPDNYDIRYNLALAHEISNNIPQAIIEYKKVLELNPDHNESKNNLQLLQNMY